VKYVYLDQRVWIELARAANGLSDDEHAKAALAIALTGVDQGLLTFPLSAAHYHETWKQGDPGKRRRLGAVMSLLSGHRTMADQQSIVDHELMLTMRAAFGRPAEARPLNLFGFGVAHAFGQPALRAYQDEIRARPELAARRALLLHEVESRMVGGPPERLPTGDIAAPSLLPAERYAEGERKLTKLLAEHPKDDGMRLRLCAGQEFLDLQERWAIASLRADVEKDEFLGLTPEQATEFILRMPWRGAIARLRWLAHADSRYRWRPNDLHDVSYLSLGAVYCDIVVAEKHWGDKLRRARVGERAGTVIVTKISELPEHLVA
jgi:hypothetical protein